MAIPKRFIGIALIGVFVVGIYVINRPKPVIDPHFHAGFQIYQDNTLLDFSSDDFMHIEVCSTDRASLPPDPEGSVHLHSNIGDVAHIHKNGVVWSDLFQNIRVAIPASAAAYLNSQQVENILSQPIHPYDSLVILIGNTTNPTEKINKAVTKSHIETVERMQEVCGT